MNKQQRDNRANQMNPNNIAYYKSRMGNPQKNPNHSPKNNSHPKNNSYNRNTKVVNVHHNHYHQNQNLGNRCPVCGKAGGLHSFLLGLMKCKHCGSHFSKSAILK